MKAFEAVLAKIGSVGQATEKTRTILVGANSLRHAAQKAEEEASNYAEEVTKIEVTDKVIL